MASTPMDRKEEHGWSEEYEPLDPSEIERLSMEEKRRERRAAIELLHQKEMEAILAISRTEQEERERLEKQASLDEERWKEEEERALEEFKAKLEEKRRKRREAEELREEKILDAVMKASLLEYNERGKIEKQAEEEDLWRQFEMEKELREIERTKAQANAEKFNKVQQVLDLKRRAHEAKESARLAVEEYQAKERLRQEKLWQLQEEEKLRQQEEQLLAVKRRQEEAVQKRLEAEQRAQEAMKRAQELREKALAAAKVVRMTSRTALDNVLQKEEDVRKEAYQRQLSALDREKEDATRIRMEKERLAQEKLARALELREQALAAAKSAMQPLNPSPA